MTNGARGNAEVDWRDAHGVRHTLLVPPRGKYLPDGRAGVDVSRRTPVRLPLAVAVAVRRTPDGRLWALQEWRVSGAVELHFARWTGSPTRVTQVADGRLTGVVTYHGAPVFGTSPTTGGAKLRVAAYVDALEGTALTRLLGVYPRSPDGSFSVFLRPEWQAPRYRVTVYGQNRGWAYAPDAFVEVGP